MTQSVEELRARVLIAMQSGRWIQEQLDADEEDLDALISAVRGERDAPFDDDRLNRIRARVQHLDEMLATPDDGPTRPVNRLIHIHQAEAVVKASAIEDVRYLLAALERRAPDGALVEAARCFSCGTEMAFTPSTGWHCITRREVHRER